MTTPVVPRHALERVRPGSPGEGLAADLRSEAVPARIAWAVALLPAAGAMVLAGMFAVHRPWMYEALREDYPVEWFQFALCAFSSLVALAAAARFAVRGQVATAGLLLLVGVLMLGLAGEEISWAQRVFDIAEPAELGAVNRQHELNVHNTDVAGIAVDSLFKIFSFLLALTGVVLSLLTRGPRPVLAGRFWWNVSPPLFTIPGFAAMALYRPLMLVLPTAVINPVTIFQEWIEVCLYLAVSATLVCAFRRAMPGRARLDLAPTPRWVLGPGTRSSARLVRVTSAVVLTVTIAFAVLTAMHGIVPGNVTLDPAAPPPDSAQK